MAFCSLLQNNSSHVLVCTSIYSPNFCGCSISVTLPYQTVDLVARMPPRRRNQKDDEDDDDEEEELQALPSDDEEEEEE